MDEPTVTQEVTLCVDTWMFNHILENTEHIESNRMKVLASGPKFNFWFLKLSCFLDFLGMQGSAIISHTVLSFVCGLRLTAVAVEIECVSLN